VGFEPTIPALERVKTVHVSDRAATVIAGLILLLAFLMNIYREQYTEESMLKNVVPRKIFGPKKEK
jgi:hypothetical protein